MSILLVSVLTMTDLNFSALFIHVDLQLYVVLV